MLHLGHNKLNTNGRDGQSHIFLTPHLLRIRSSANFSNIQVRLYVVPHFKVTQKCMMLGSFA